MSTDKASKRLVGLLEYLDKTSEKATGYVFAGTFASVAVILLLWSVIGIVAGTIHLFCLNIGYAIFIWTGSAVVGGLGMGARWVAKTLYREAKQIGPVVLHTKVSQKRLPDGEALLRASDTPPSKEQLELLRVAQYSPDTPDEQLLRASTESNDR